MYAKMLRIRLFGERQAEESKLGKIFGYVHLYTGQEAVAVGVITALQPGDKITSTHRAEGHFIAAGVPLKEIMAECFGRRTGVCGGHSGPMGLAAVDYGIVSAYEIVGGGIAVATGIAWAFKMQRIPNVVACFFGDGAANRGVLHESMNMAALWKLPVIYICENNGYAVDTSVERAFATPRIAPRAAGFGLPGFVVDGTEIFPVYDALQEARARAIAGDGPTFLEMVAPRWCGHHLADPQWYYRTREEVEERKQHCAIGKLRATLLERSLMSEEEDKALKAQIKFEVEEAAQFAESSEWPSEEDLYAHLFASSGEA
jgi:TPP-dependent pyruvate/acetoin dehydrogenase alpha subunit